MHPRFGDHTKKKWYLVLLYNSMFFRWENKGDSKYVGETLSEVYMA